MNSQSDNCNAIQASNKPNDREVTTSGNSAFCAKISRKDTRNLCLQSIR